MGYVINPNDIVEVTMQGRYQGSQILNVFHFYNSGGLIDAVNSDSQMNAMLTSFKTAFWTGGGSGLQSLVTDGYSLEVLRGQPILATRRYYIDKGIDEAGSVAGAGVPSDTHMCINTRSGAVGRGRTGNKKVTALSVSALDEASWTFAARTAMNLAFVPLLTPLNDDGGVPRWVWCVWSPAIPTDRNPVIGVRARGTVRVMRRRELFRGV